MNTRYCEFPGEGDDPWDGARKAKCTYLGFRLNPVQISVCILHSEAVGETPDGWRTCCQSCVTPVYVGG